MKDVRESDCTGANCAGHGFGVRRARKSQEMMTMRHCFRSRLNSVSRGLAEPAAYCCFHESVGYSLTNSKSSPEIRRDESV